MLGELANSLGANLRLGRGKKARIIKDLEEKLGTKCVYCTSILTPANCTYDHKIAIGSKKERAESKARLFDAWDNLHLTCKRCNRFKGDLDHDEYKGLLILMAKHPLMRRKLELRFYRERRSYK